MEAGAETAIENVKLPEVLIEKQTLYHGSRAADISAFNAAEESTIGAGLYLTSDKDAAAAYAIRRSQLSDDFKATVYEVEVNNLRMADLRTDEAKKPFATLLKTRLEEESKKPNIKWYHQAALAETINSINENSYKSLKDLTWHHQDVVSQLLKEQKFDGLIAIEGGEGDEMGNHDSYVIFDPSKAEIKSHETVN